MHIAIVRMTALGDIVHTLASIQFVKNRYPHSRIAWFVEKKFAAILQDHPQIDAIVPIDLHGLKKDFSFKKLADIFREIKSAGPFDRVIDVQGLLKSAAVARIAGSNTYGLDHFSARETMASYFYRHRFGVDCAGVAPMRFAKLIAYSLDFEITYKQMLEKRPYLFYHENESTKEIEHFLDPSRKNVLIVTGASHTGKTYPSQKWIEVVEGLQGRNVLLVAGSPKEREEARTVTDATHARLLPPTDLNGLKFAVGRCDLLIGADTGPTHMAWAMNRPSVVLFGSTPRTMMMETPINVALTGGTPKHPCRFDKSDRSVAHIPPERIVRTAERLLA